MSHITEQQGPAFVSNGSKSTIVPIPWVGTSTADNKLGAEVKGFLLKLIVVDISGRGADLVRETLEVNGGGRNLLTPGGIVAVGKVSTGREIEAHDTIVGVEQSCVGGEIGRATGVGLDVDAPPGGIEAVGSEGAGAAKILDGVDVLVPAVVAVSGHALGVLISEGATKGFDDGEGGEVFGGDELDAMGLTALLVLDEVVYLRVNDRER